MENGKNKPKDADNPFVIQAALARKQQLESTTPELLNTNNELLTDLAARQLFKQPVDVELGEKINAQLKQLLSELQELEKIEKLITENGSDSTG